ncbi:putative alpha-1,2-mannosidase [Promicromonospora umidemergens]|uniref:GH92 family glycosyl hydrolase n=1 Tax=Promicromonospora umidemergens TaxID=629679 RepID=A0ABP8XL26_9MICO|nr:GH92 family glycosyl hydrolase [Promicromonospora umidemergens]MCP2282127.1 putative alpha-1,2-mannosidase [Promicromonospora umidemergens]
MSVLTGRARPRRTAAALSGALALLLVLPTGVALAAPDGTVPGGTASEGTVPGQAHRGDFATSFEDDDPAPIESTPAERDGAPWQDNVGEFVPGLPGSVLEQVGAVTASGENPPNEAAANLTDWSSATKWLTFARTGAITYELTEPTAVTAYSLTSANDFADRDPQAWTLQGSTDGETWETLDERSGEKFSERFQRQVYELDGATEAYSHFRLDITRNNGSDGTQLADWDLSEDLAEQPAEQPMVTAVGSGPQTVSFTNKKEVGFTGTRSLRYEGGHLGDGAAHATNVLYDDVDVRVRPGTRLSWKIFPELLGDLKYPSTYAAVDLRFTDGTYLSDLDARDAHGTAATAAGQGAGKILYADQWNSVRVDVGAVARGKKIDQVLVGYDNDAGGSDEDGVGTRFAGWLDDVALEARPERIDGSSLTGYVDTRRGTLSSGSFSRGNNVPATAVPNGFNFWTPMTNASTDRWLYEYQAANDDQNRTVLQGIGISHEPSPWMGDRNQLAFQPATGAGVPDAGLDARGLPFSHADETARPDYYGVTFAGGIEAEVAPTDHAAVLRFSFPRDTPGDAGHVLVDRVLGSSELTFDEDTGELSGWVENGSSLSVGRTRMYVAGTFDRAPSSVGAAAGDRDGARYATFDTRRDRTVELRVATSFIGLDQARANLDLEVTDRSFRSVQRAAERQWNERLGVIETKGGSEAELVTLYSNLYRLNLYPNSQFENTGTARKPEYRYASPVTAPTGDATDTRTNAQVVDGKIYVNNGFWDTYRTAWPAYSLLYPDVAAELVDGFVQQYRDGGWVARWSSPGYADLMTGTSSDVAFADAYLKGSLPVDKALDAYDAALKNGTVSPPNDAVGRKGLESSPFLGFTPESTHESVSWGLEGLINDFGIGNMAAALAEDPGTPDERREALREESAYFLERTTHYGALFDPAIDFFQPRHADGEFLSSPDEYDPRTWGGGYTETSGWNFSFHAPQDPNGLANLYGGQDGLEAKLDTFFATPEDATHTGGYGGVIHEMREARDIRLGQWGMSNQVSHHIPWLYGAAGAPHKTQEIVREVTRRLFVGSEIGQGYPGDEDNGEMSSWWIFAALGFYPMQVGSDQYAIGSPLFDQATVHLPDGDLVINARNNSVENVYVQSLRVDGKKRTSTSLSQADLSGGARLDFVMGAEPSSWGTGEDDAPPSLTEGDEPPSPARDTTGTGTVTVDDGTEPAALTDNTSASRTTFGDRTPTITWDGSGSGSSPGSGSGSDSDSGATVGTYTLTSGAAGTAAPSAWRLEGSDDGESWTVLDERAGQEFRWALQTRPFQVDDPRPFERLRIVVEEAAGEGDLSLAELELLADQGAGADELPLGPADGAAGQGADAETRAATRAAAEAQDAASGITVWAVPVCTDGDAALRVQADGPTAKGASTSVTVTSDFGTETLRGSGDVTFEAGSADVGTGAVTAVVEVTIDGERATETLTVPYEAGACG